MLRCPALRLRVLAPAECFPDPGWLNGLLSGNKGQARNKVPDNFDISFTGDGIRFKKETTNNLVTSKDIKNSTSARHDEDGDGRSIHSEEETKKELKTDNIHNEKRVDELAIGWKDISLTSDESQIDTQKTSDFESNRTRFRKQDYNDNRVTESEAENQKRVETKETNYIKTRKGLSLSKTGLETKNRKEIRKEKSKISNEFGKSKASQVENSSVGGENIHKTSEREMTYENKDATENKSKTITDESRFVDRDSLNMNSNILGTSEDDGTKNYEDAGKESMFDKLTEIFTDAQITKKLNIHSLDYSQIDNDKDKESNQNSNKFEYDTGFASKIWRNILHEIQPR